MTQALHQMTNAELKQFTSVDRNDDKAFRTVELKLFRVAVELVQNLYEFGKSYLSANPVIIGVVLGFILSQLATYFKDWITIRKKAKDVYKMLEIELKHNLVLLSHFNDSLEIELTRNPKKITTRSIPFPNWQCKVFESHLTSMSDALSEEEIIEVFDFYKSLDVIAGNYSNLSKLKVAVKEAIEAGNETSKSGGLGVIEAQKKWSEGRKLEDEFIDEWNAFEELIKEILENGSSLLQPRLQRSIYKLSKFRVLKINNSL